MKPHYLILACFYFVLLFGCTAKPVQRHFQYVNEVSQAESLIQRGELKKAASLYQSLAKLKPVQRDQYNLLAAETLLQSGDSQTAYSLAKSINQAVLSSEQRNQLNFLYAQIMLSNGEAEQALNKLNATQPHLFKQKKQITYYQSLAFANSLASNPIQSVQARINLNPLLSKTRQDENNRVIFTTLNLLPSKTLALKQASAPHQLAGWLMLTRILKNQFQQDSAEFDSDLQEWKQLFPRHPADSGFLLSYFEKATHPFKMPSSIALLLPESGRFSLAAEVIKQGFLAAYEYSPSGFRPSIQFYDSSSSDPVTLYQQAISDGAELIIGPLSKNNIQILALNAELMTPVLALNHIPDLVKNNLFQFGLSPIDEAIQITTNARQAGHVKALLLTPNTRQGQRSNNHLSKYWEQLGGEVLGSQSYNINNNDFSKPIKKLLNLQQSSYRYKKVRQFLAPNSQFTERRRQDVDVILLSASSKIARSIYPQLLFYRATRIPVYAMPQLYAGQLNLAQDRDLDKITFCDIPWLFPVSYPGKLSKESLREIWKTFPKKYIKLMALGIDSFNIISHLSQLGNTPYLGATGKLSLNMENRITRQLVCAKFVKGEPVLQIPLYAEDDWMDDNDQTSSEYFVQ